MASWIDEVNYGQNIHEFVTESFLVERIRAGDDLSELNWMKIFNSKIPLSKVFIVGHVQLINWNWLFRALPEPTLNRFQKRVVQWNAQLYGQLRTIEFMLMHRTRFDWNQLSANPPLWFTDFHYEVFADSLNWKLLSKHTKRMSLTLVVRLAERLDWEIITVNDIRSEAFATKFINDINWDHPKLDISHLSTEFLYNVYDVRMTAMFMDEDEFDEVRLEPNENPLLRWATHSIAHGMTLTKRPRAGSSITVPFLLSKVSSYDWTDETLLAAASELLSNPRTEIEKKALLLVNNAISLAYAPAA